MAIEESVRRIRADRARPRDALARGGRRRRVRRDRAAAGADGGGGDVVRGPSRQLHGRGRRRVPARDGGHAAVGRAQRAPPERHRPRLPGGARPPGVTRAGWSSSWRTTVSACGRRWWTTASASRTASPSTRSTGLGLSIVRTLVTTELMGTISLERGPTTGAAAGHRGRGLDVPVVERAVTASRPRRDTDLLPAGQEVGGQETEVQAERRWRATYCLRSWRRSSSEVPPHTPESWLVARAYSRHGAWASHCRQTALAFSICSMAGPVVPTGKNRSGSVSRHARHRASRHARW